MIDPSLSKFTCDDSRKLRGRAQVISLLALLVLVLLVAPPAFAQDGLSKEYIYLGQKMLAIETGCRFTLTPSAQSFPPAGGTGSVTVSAPPGCPLTASFDVSWITI